MKVRLHIDRLVVDGVDLGPGGAARLRSAVESELARLFMADGWRNPASMAVPSLSAGAIPVASNPAQMGTQVARVLYDGLTGGGGPRR